MPPVRLALLVPAAMAIVGVVPVAGTRAPSPLPSPQQTQTPVFRSRADLVPVYVVAVDADGEPVTDLTAADFTLRDRGRVQEIAVFDNVRRTAVSDDAATALPPDVPRDVANNRGETTDRVVVVVVDDLHMYRKRDEMARRLTRQLIGTLADGSMMALLFTSGARGTQITDDHAELLHLAEGLKGRRAVPRPVPAVDRQSPPRHDPENIDAVRAAAAQAQSASLQDFNDNLTYYRTLRDAARMLRADDGRRKVFVVVSEGIGKDLTWLGGGVSPGDLTGNAAAAAAAAENRNEAVRAPEELLPSLSFHDEELLGMMRELRRSNVATYALDPRGHVPDEELLGECHPVQIANDPCWFGHTNWNSLVRQSQQGLETTSRLSGGFAVTNTDGFDRGIARIRSDLDNYYLLGFYPSQPEGKGFRQLRIDVHREGVTLRFRQGYEVAPPDVPKAGRDPLTTLATMALPNADVPLRLFAAPFPGTGRTARVAVTIEVAEPFAAVADAQGHVSDDLRYSILAADVKSGKAVQLLQNTARLSSKSALEGNAPPMVFFQLPMTLSLPPGRYQLRASALSDKLAGGGSVFLSLEVPDFARERVSVSGLVVGSTTAPEMPTARPPAPTDLVPFAPSLDRQFDRSDTLRMVFQVARANARPAQVSFDVVDAAGVDARSIQIPIGQGDDGVVDLKLPLADFGPGAYRLRVRARSAGTTAEREIGIVIR